LALKACGGVFGKGGGGCDLVRVFKKPRERGEGGEVTKSTTNLGDRVRQEVLGE